MTHLRALSLTTGLLLLSPTSVFAARCENTVFYNDDCSRKISPGAAFGIAISIFAIIVIVLATLSAKRRKRAQQANLAFIHNAQAQQSYNQGYNPNPTPNYAPNYPSQSYPSPNYQSPGQQTNYPPPPGPPPHIKGQEGSHYNPTDVPQAPPPTYSNV